MVFCKYFDLRRGSQFRRGFTALEAMMTIGILTAVTVITVPLLSQYQIRNNMAIAKNQITQGLERAKLNAMAGKNDDVWSFYIPEGVLFKGSDYANRDQNFDEVYPQPSDIKTSGLVMVTYDGDGRPDTTGIITLSALNGDIDTIQVTIEVDHEKVATTVGDALIICHQGYHTMTITDASWPGHQGHGDTVGPCGGSSSSSVTSAAVSSSAGMSSSAAISSSASSVSSSGNAGASSSAGGGGGSSSAASSSAGGGTGGGGASSSSSVTCTDPSGLVGYWKFDDASGSTAADASGNANAGILLNMSSPWATGAPGSASPVGALMFDGNNDTVRINKTSSINDLPVKTVTAWIKPDVAGQIARIADKTSWFVDLESPNTLTYYHKYGSSDYAMWRTPTNSITMGVWNHIAVAYDSSSLSNVPQFYINGVLQTVTVIQAPPSALLTDAFYDLTLGNRLAGDRGLKDIMDDVRLYNRALAANEIQNIAAGKSLCTGGASSSSSTSQLCPGKFMLNPSTGAITIADDTTVTFKNMLSKITWGTGGPVIPVHACYSDDNGSSFNHLYGGNGSCTGNGVAKGNAVKVNGTDLKSVSLSSGDQLVVRVNGRYKQQGWLAFDATYQTGDQTNQIQVLRDGDAVSNRAGFGNQVGLRDYLDGQLLLDSQKKLNIGPCNLLVVTELGALNTSASDFQDDVMQLIFQ